MIGKMLTANAALASSSVMQPTTEINTKRPSLYVRRNRNRNSRTACRSGSTDQSDTDLTNFFHERDAYIRKGLIGKTFKPDCLDTVYQHKASTVYEENPSTVTLSQSQENQVNKETHQTILQMLLISILYTGSRSLKEPYKTILQMFIIFAPYVIKRNK